jgi:Cu/Ag efflux protein CusF
LSATLVFVLSEAHADCCIFPKPADLAAAAKAQKSFEARIKQVDKDAGMLKLEGLLIPTGGTFTVQPKEKLRQFREGDLIKATLTDPKNMKFEYEILRK